jgi:hypothetical protein
MTMNAAIRPLPPQDSDKILLHAQRWRRAADALQKWSDTARKCVDYFEGRQWSEADLRKLQLEKRPALTLNKIRPLVNLVLGYFLNQRTDIRFLPGYDGEGTAELAQVLSHIELQISEMSQLGFVNAEVYLDGLLTGRGYFDTRIDFQRNDLGDVRTRAADNFAVYIDPDLDDYDLNQGSYIMRSRWISLDEIELFYGMDAVNRIGPFMQSGGVATGMPTGIAGYQEETSPVRRFAMESDAELASVYSDQFYDFVDINRRNVRLLDIEHYVRVKRWFFVDLETGSSKPVPDHWDQDRVDKAIAWSKENGQPVVVQQRLDRRLRCAHMIGDVIVYDRWSKYDTMSLTGFFPYFRRGMTQGMVEHLLDPQDEVNKRRSARLNMIGRSANGGWAYAKGSLDAQAKTNLERFGSTPGFQMEYDTKGGTLPAPAQIQPSVTPVAMSQLEQEAEDDLKKISGINDSALGMIDQSVMSGKAIERRQKQTIVGLEHYVTNFRRTTELLGRKHLELIQAFYTERRVIRATGRGTTQVAMIINERTAGGIINDVTLGSFAVAVDQTPMSKSFMEAQFEEMLSLKQMGMPIPDDFLIDASSMDRKEELKASLAAARKAQSMMGHNGGPAMDGEESGAPPQSAGPGPGGSRVGIDGGSLPSGPEPGAPVPMAG